MVESLVISKWNVFKWWSLQDDLALFTKACPSSWKDTSLHRVSVIKFSQLNLFRFTDCYVWLLIDTIDRVSKRCSAVNLIRLLASKLNSSTLKINLFVILERGNKWLGSTLRRLSGQNRHFRSS